MIRRLWLRFIGKRCTFCGARHRATFVLGSIPMYACPQVNGINIVATRMR